LGESGEEGRPTGREEGVLEGERERERERFSQVKYGRERERCRPVETESGEGRPTGREEGVPEGEIERVRVNFERERSKFFEFCFLFLSVYPSISLFYFFCLFFIKAIK